MFQDLPEGQTHFDPDAERQARKDIVEPWEEKIRRDYGGIISQELIEATIEYWRTILQAEKAASYAEGVKDGESTKNGMERYLLGAKDERARLLAELEKRIEKSCERETGGDGTVLVNPSLSEIRAIIHEVFDKK